MLRQGLDILRADELVVVGSPDVCDVSTASWLSLWWWLLEDKLSTNNDTEQKREEIYLQTSVRMGFSGLEAGEKGV